VSADWSQAKLLILPTREMPSYKIDPIAEVVGINIFQTPEVDTISLLDFSAGTRWSPLIVTPV
jgi:hypothetical protein